MINNIKENLYPVKLKYYLASPARRIYETKYFFAHPFSLLDSESVMNIVCIQYIVKFYRFKSISRLNFGD